MSTAAATRQRRSLVSPLATAWGYVRHELLFICFALMEVALLTPVALVILGWARYWPPALTALWLLLLMLIPLNLIRLMSLLHFSPGRQRWVMILVLLVTVLASWRLLLYTSPGPLDLGWLGQFAANLAEAGNLLWARDLSVFLITIFFWWRGIRLALRTPEINNVGLRLRVGGLILAPLVIWFSNRFLDVSILPFILMFFLAGLVALSLVRAEQIERERQGTAATLNARWFVVVFTAALLTVLAAGMIAVFIAGESLFAALGWFSPLWRALQFAGAVIALTLFKLIGPLFEALFLVVQFLAQLLALLLGRVSAGLQASGILNLETPAIPTPTETIEVVGPTLGGRSLTALLLLGLIVLVSLALARAYQQATLAARESERSRTATMDEEPRPGIVERLLGRLGVLRGWRTAASIRRIYKQMCASAATAGHPRLEAETPYEFLPTLALVWPDHRQETSLITEAFVRVRYGELPESADELARIRQAWATLEQAQPVVEQPKATAQPTLIKRE